MAGDAIAQAVSDLIAMLGLLFGGGSGDLARPLKNLRRWTPQYAQEMLLSTADADQALKYSRKIWKLWIRQETTRKMTQMATAILGISLLDRRKVCQHG